MMSNLPLPGRVGGAFVLGLTLVLVLVATAAALEQLRVGRAAERQGPVMHERLLQAKVALLGYAASYADQHPSELANGVGPGFLPCPDVGRDGSPDPACPLGATGFLPWRRLGLLPPPAVEEGRLRYALADRHRSNPHKWVPLNPHHLGRLARGEHPRWVARLQARGAVSPTLGEGRRTRETGIAAATMGRVMTQRALAEAEQAIRRFRGARWNPGRFPPALSAGSWEASSRSPGAEVVTVSQGHLRVHRPGVFPSGFTLRLRSPPQRPRRLARLPTRPLTVRVAAGECLWTHAARFTCAGLGRGWFETRPEYDFPAHVWFDLSPGARRNHSGAGGDNGWRIDIRSRRSANGAASGPRVGAPPPGAMRTRSLLWRGALPGRSFVGIRLISPGRHRAAFAAFPADPVELEVQGVNYWLEAPGDIAPWFIEHRWEALLAVRYGAGFAAGHDLEPWPRGGSRPGLPQPHRQSVPSPPRPDRARCDRSRCVRTGGLASPQWVPGLVWWPAVSARAGELDAVRWNAPARGERRRSSGLARILSTQ